MIMRLFLPSLSSENIPHAQICTTNCSFMLDLQVGVRVSPDSGLTPWSFVFVVRVSACCPVSFLKRFLVPVHSHSLRHQPLCSGGGGFHFFCWLGLVSPNVVYTPHARFAQNGPPSRLCGTSRPRNIRLCMTTQAIDVRCTEF